MFNFDEFTKTMLIDLYNKKSYIGAKVRELALNYLIKGLISQATLEEIDNYITSAEKSAEVTEESAEDIVEPVEEVEG
jgi:hypothetical protein